MTKDQIQSFINSYLSKQAEEGPAHEAAETPNAEMLEHAMGVGAGGEEEQPHGAGPGGVDVEQLLAQLSPEELQELIAQLSQGGHPGEGAPGEGAPEAGGDDVAGLSQNIESHLAQNPEAQVPGMEPEKAAALDFVKSANYIEGFIKQALDYGLNVDQAVGMYDNALTTTVETMKKEAASKGVLDKGVQLARSAGKKTLRAASNAATGAKNYVTEKAQNGYDAAAGHFNKRKGTYGRVAGGVGGGLAAGYAIGNSSTDKEKSAAYIEGMFKQALAHGYNSEEAEQLVENFLDKEAATSIRKLKRRPLQNAFREQYHGPAAPKGPLSRGNQRRAEEREAFKASKNPPAAAAPAAPSKADRFKNFAKSKAGIATGVGALALGGAGVAASKSSDKEKKAAYLEGVFKQAMAYGFSEAEAVQFAQQAEASL